MCVPARPLVDAYRNVGGKVPGLDDPSSTSTAKPAAATNGRGTPTPKSPSVSPQVALGAADQEAARRRYGPSSSLNSLAIPTPNKAGGSGINIPV